MVMFDLFSRCDGVTDTTNRASQGLVRYVDVVATRNGEVPSRNIMSGSNQKSDTIFLLGTASSSQVPCTNVLENAARVSKQVTGDENRSNKNSDSKMPSSSRKNEGCNSKNNRSSNKNSESCKQNGSSSANKETTLVCKNGKSFVRSVEVSKSKSEISKQESEVGDTDCSQLPPVDSAELPSNRSGKELVYGNDTCQLNRVTKFPIRGGETYAMRMKNQEGRTYLSDVANVENKTVSDVMWAKNSSGKSTVGVSNRTGTSKPKNAETVVGPRHCSLRLQAGSSNILLDNATSYSPVLYTNRHNGGGGGDVSSAVLVHIPRSRSASASSTDEVQQRGDGKLTSWVHSPTETEL
jgi:hypothetical protein